MPIPFPFDFKNPDYTEVFDWRVERLTRLRKDPTKFQTLNEFYKTDPAQYIIDWGCTFDPRNVSRGLPAVIPFILFPRQEEWVHWFLDLWKTEQDGVTAKSRDGGLTWLSVAVAVSLCQLHPSTVCGFGSRKEEYVDKRGDPKSILQKARQYISMLPREFRFGWDERKCSAHMKIQFPHNGSLITGEAGDNIGRGDRYSFAFIDEAAHLEHPALIDAALSATSECRIDISTPCGTDNPFAQKFLQGKTPSFRFHWRDDPRKDEAWYANKCDKIGDPVIIAQEYDLDFSASVTRVVIPSTWVQSAIDAHKKLNIVPTGVHKASLDVADEGKDKNAFGGCRSFLVDYIEEWSGKDSDIFKTVEHAKVYGGYSRI